MVDPIRQANERLRQLGYEPGDASVDANGSPPRLRLTGSLLNAATADAADMLEVLRLLPPKSHLLAFRHMLRLDR